MVILSEDFEARVSEVSQQEPLVESRELERNEVGQPTDLQRLDAEMVTAFDVDLEVVGNSVLFENLGELSCRNFDRNHFASGQALPNKTIQPPVARSSPQNVSTGSLGDSNPQDGQLARSYLAFEAQASDLDQDRVRLHRHNPKSSRQVVSRIEAAIETNVKDQFRIEGERRPSRGIRHAAHFLTKSRAWGGQRLAGKKASRRSSLREVVMTSVISDS